MKDEKLLNRIDPEAFAQVSKKIAEVYNISEEEADDYLMKFGPKKMRRMGILSDPGGWRDGYTKKSIGRRVGERRKKQKMAKKSRRKNR